MRFNKRIATLAQTLLGRQRRLATTLFLKSIGRRPKGGPVSASLHQSRGIVKCK
jgi:hypothetical protein